MIRVPEADQSTRLAKLEQRLAKLQARVPPLRESLLRKQSGWEEEMKARLANPDAVEKVWVDDEQIAGGKLSGEWNFVSGADAPVYSGRNSRRQSAKQLVQHYVDDLEKQVTVRSDTQFYVWVYLDAKNPPQAIMLQLNDGTWEHRAVWGSDDIRYGRKPESWAGYRRSGDLPATGRWVRLAAAAERLGLKPGSQVKGMAFTQSGGLAYWDQAGWFESEGIPLQVAEALDADQRTARQRATLQEYYLNHASPLVRLEKEIGSTEKAVKQVEESAPLTVVSRAVEPRPIRILPRGNWMDETGEVVEPAIPGFLGKLDTATRPSRLDLANWLCQPDNVLTSRTMVNRLWFLLFGRGLCESVDDLGGQGSYPSHPELLDWLAAEFVDSGWDIKHTIRTIVHSGAYRRSSKPTDTLRDSDPYNRLLARQGRFSIAAEMVRDSELAISGLLVEQVGGRSVKPYQPAGYYAQLNFPRRKYAADSGANQYRRGLYTHWQRTFLHPMLKAFDAPSREECTARRAVSNTPLQALTLLNDPTFVEAARTFAARIVQQGGVSVRERIEWAYRAALSRSPEAMVLRELERVYADNHAQFQSQDPLAHQLIGHGDAPVNREIDPAELGAWTCVARVILNLHETITRY